MKVCAATSALLMSISLGCSEESKEPPTRTDSPSKHLPESTSSDGTQGQAVYVQSCLLCHQKDGSGVPGMQPPLIDNAAVMGDPSHLIEVVLRGVGSSETAFPGSGDYSMVMPSAATLTDEQISQVLTYIRQAFADEAPIKPEEVAAVRASLE